MRKEGCINPLIMEALTYAGHGDRILITDGNYPAKGKIPDHARVVYLGLSAGKPTVTEVLQTILKEINVEAVLVMAPEEGRPEIFDEFEEMLPGIVLEEAGRWEYYKKASASDVQLVISTGEERTFANLLLTVGCA